MTVAFDSSVMASSRLAHQIQCIPLFSKQDLAALRLQSHFLTLDQTGLWICGGLQRIEVAGDHADAIQDHFHCQSCQDHCYVSLLCVCVWELWFIRIIHSQTRLFHPLEQSFSSSEPDLASLCKSCCMFL